MTYDGYRYRTTPAGATATVPTALMRRGDFSEFLGPQIGTDALGRPILRGQIYDPLTTRSDGRGGFIRDPFPNNVIPESRLSSISRAFQGGYYLPNQPGTQINWVGSLKPFPTDQDRITVKADHNFGPNHRFSFGYDNIARLHNRGGAGLFEDTIAFYYLNDVNQPRARLNYTWIMRPDLLLDMRAGFTQRSQRIGNQASADFGQTAGLRGVNDPSTPTVTIQGVSGFGPVFRRLDSYYQNIPGSLNLAWTKGSHNFKFGAEYFLSTSRQVTELGTSGNFSFADRGTGLPGQTATGVGYASYLLGEVDTSSLSSPTANRFGQSTWGFYAHDQWRVTQKLTLNVGLRYDLFLPARETYNRIGHFDPTVPNPAAGGRLGAITFYGQGTGRNGLQTFQDVYYKAFGPRVGIAYAFNPKTVVRSSYGISYTPLYLAFGFPANIGWSASVSPATLDNGVTPAFNWNNGFPPVFPVLPNLSPSIVNGSGVPYIARTNIRPGRTQNLNFGIERELPFRIAVRADYIGNLTHGLPNNGLVQLNQLDPRYFALGDLLLANISSAQAQAAGIVAPYPGFTGSVAQALRPFPQYQGVNQVAAPAGFSLYHSFQFNVQKRFGEGLSFLAAYTIEKQLSSGGIQHTTLRTLSKNLGNDRPQLLALSYVYDLPFGPGKRFANSNSAFVKQVVGGWQVSGIHNYMSGYPVGVSTRATIPGGVGGIWANRVPDVPIATGNTCDNYDPNDPARNRYLNIAAFSTPAPYTFGNTSLLPNVRGCSYLNESLSVQKRFPISEGSEVRFGVEFFNVFNRHQWLGLNGDINNLAAFGRFSGASDPRSIQFLLKVQF